jgi:hypothetical protein
VRRFATARGRICPPQAQTYLADVLARIADHPVKQVAELLSWNWQPANPIRIAA